jgi:tRNA A-37 threonylcarbamoyl transferase component Bud32
MARGGRVFEHAVDGRKVVVKRYVKPDMIFVHVFQNFLARLLREPMLLRTDALGGDIYREPQKLSTLRENGLNVPEVLYECSDYFVLEYVGQNLESVLKRERGDDRRNKYITRALGQLRAMHEKNFVHGGAQVKNFTCLDGEVFMIDFEEIIPGGYAEDFKRRDLLLFAMSLETAGISRGFKWICDAYGGASGGVICASLASSLRKYRFLKFLKAKVFSWIKMNDVRAIIALIEEAEGLLN